jgi:peptidoglycan-associated lipoprotein
MLKNFTLLFLVSLITLSCSQRFSTSTIESRNLEDIPDQEITIESGDIVDENIISPSEPELTTLNEAENSVIDDSANSSVNWSLLNNDDLLKIRSFYYEFDSYSLDSKYNEIINAHAKFILKNNLSVAINGNCDSRGSREYNIALGDKRANSVKDLLILYGVNKNNVETISFGSEKPLSYGENEESWSKNRRSDIVYPDEP